MSAVADGVTSSTVTITLLDSGGNPLSNITPSFSVSGSGNSLGTCSATNLSGISTCSFTSTTAEIKTLGITAPIVEFGGTVTFSAGAPDHLVWLQQPTDGVAINDLSPAVTLKIVDSHGNATSSTAAVSLAILNNAGSGTLTGGGTASAIAGTVSFAGLSLDKVGTGYTLQATAPSLPTSTSGASATFNIVTGTISLALSTLTISPASIVGGSTGTVTLNLFDGGGNQIADTGEASQLSLTLLSSGTSSGTFGAFSAVSGNAGAYQATLTAINNGTANTFKASFSGTPTGDFSTHPSFTVTLPAAPVLTLPNSLLYPIASSHPPAVQGSTSTLSISATGAGTVSLNCTYETVGLSSSDPNYAAPGGNTPCTSLNTFTVSGTGTLYVTNGATLGIWTTTPGPGAATGTINWTPTQLQRGTYRFILTATDGFAQTSSGSVYVSVMENYTTTNLLTLLDAIVADVGQSSPLSSVPAEPRLTGNSNNSTSGAFQTVIGLHTGSLIDFTSSAPYQGTGRSSTIAVDPYALAFDGTNDALTLGTVLSSSSEFAIQTWVKPSSPSTAGSVIASNSSGTATTNGFQLRQSTAPTGRAEFAVGNKYYSYRDYVLSLAPIAYWRLNENSGTTANDSSAFGNSGTYAGGFTLGQGGALTGSGDSDASVLFSGTGYVTTSASANFIPAANSPITISAWINPTAISATSCGTSIPNRMISLLESGAGASTLGIGIGSSNRICFYNDSTATYTFWTGTILANQWSYVTLAYDGTCFQRYLNGSPDGACTTGNLVVGSTTAGSTSIGSYKGTSTFFNGRMDDVSIHNYALTGTEVSNLYAAGTTTHAVPYPGNAIMADNPVAYWRLGERSGRVAYDYSGNSNQGIYSGGVTLGHVGALTGSGDSDAAVLFNGSTGQITVNDSNSLDMTTGSYEFWLKTTATAPSLAILSKGAGNYQVYMNGGDIFVAAKGSCNLAKSSVVVNDGVLHHVVAIINGSAGKVYVDGVNRTTVGLSCSIAPNTTALSIASNSGANFFSGVLDEVAIYNYVLSPTQIANHYNAGLGAGWWYCQSQSLLNSSYGNFLSAIYNGSTAQIFTNGQVECSVTPSTTYTGSLGSTFAGATSALTQFWNGAISYFSILGSSSTPTTAANIQRDFSATANRWRAVPIENIVTANLVTHLDAGNASLGTQPYANGCPTSALSWFDLSSNANNSTLANFASCSSTTGWYNSGSSSGPFYLALNGTNNYATNAIPSTLSTYSFEAWAKITTTVPNAAVISQASAATSYLNLGSGSAPWQFNSAAATTAATTSVWTHVVGVQNGSTQTLYVNGMLAGTASASTNVSQIDVGRRGDGIYFNGDIAVVRVYSSALTLQQVKQNCYAQQGRFGVSSCASP